jgi:hypothetical protein
MPEPSLKYPSISHITNAGGTQYQIQEALHVHIYNQMLSEVLELYKHVSISRTAQILAAVGDLYLAALKDTDFGYAGIELLQMLSNRMSMQLLH